MSISLEGLHAGYRGRPVLRGIELEFEAGRVTALLGPNGSGKSTLLKAIAGLVPSTGVMKRGPGPIGYLPQDASARAILTVFETVLLGRVGALGLRVAPAELAAAAATLELLGLAGLADRSLDELSGGQRQMVFLAQVLAGQPRILMLDEPTSALDLRNQVEMLQLVRQLSRAQELTTIIAIHDLNAAVRFVDRLVLLHDGAVRASGLATNVLRPDLLAKVYGVAAFVVPGPDGHPLVMPYGVAPAS